VEFAAALGERFANAGLGSRLRLAPQRRPGKFPGREPLPRLNPHNPVESVHEQQRKQPGSRVIADARAALEAGDLRCVVELPEATPQVYGDMTDTIEPIARGR
jgi:hypothetical protein